MNLIKTTLDDAYIIENDLSEDERGCFSRIFCRNEFNKFELEVDFVQVSIAFNKKKGTIRGMHYQKYPHEEVKIVWCPSGAIHDVIIDLRPGSKTYKKWFSIELTSTNHKMIYVPKGFAHGYQTLEDHTNVVYHMSEFFSPEFYTGVKWNDLVFNITWPITENIIISNKDKSYKDFLL